MFDARMLGLLGYRDTDDAERRAGFGERAVVVGDLLGMGPRHETRPGQGRRWAIDLSIFPVKFFEVRSIPLASPE